MTWTSDLVVPSGHQMTFKDALHILSTNIIIQIILPNWAKYLTRKTREVDLAFKELKVCYSKLSTVIVSSIRRTAAIYVGNGGSSQECGQRRTTL
jgi:hypothetical protein